MSITLNYTLTTRVYVIIMCYCVACVSWLPPDILVFCAISVLMTSFKIFTMFLLPFRALPVPTDCREKYQDNYGK